MIRTFNRFELKYVVPRALRDVLLDEIGPNMRPDAAGLDGAYAVTSLYYDTRDFACVRSKLDGIRYRRKVRIRAYGEVPQDAAARVLVEIKQRIDRTVQKRRLALPLAEAYALCEGDLDLDRSWEDPRDRAAASEVSFLARTLNLAPACVVGYQRHAFAGGQYEPRLRITFDDTLWCRPPSALLSPTDGRHFFLPLDWMILEVKVDHAVPLWVSRMLARHSVRLSRFSKYCTAITKLSPIGLLFPGLRGDANG